MPSYHLNPEGQTFLWGYLQGSYPDLYQGEMLDDWDPAEADVTRLFSDADGGDENAALIATEYLASFYEAHKAYRSLADTLGDSPLSIIARDDAVSEARENLGAPPPQIS